METTVDILVIDDDPDLGIMVTAILKYAGYRVIHSAVADSVDELILKYAPRVLLMDMLLSGMDGRDICRSLKAAADTRHIYIVMMSAHPDADITCRQAGADDFIGKPFDMDHFLGKIKKAATSHTAF